MLYTNAPRTGGTASGTWRSNCAYPPPSCHSAFCCHKQQHDALALRGFCAQASTPSGRTDRVTDTFICMQRHKEPLYILTPERENTRHNQIHVNKITCQCTLELWFSHSEIINAETISKTRPATSPTTSLWGLNEAPSCTCVVRSSTGHVRFTSSAKA